MAELAARPPHRHVQHGDAGNVIALVDRITLLARLRDLRLPLREARRFIPAQGAEARFDLRIGMIAERGDATAGGADQRREAPADLRAELKVRPGLRGRDDDDVVETDDLPAEQRQVELLTEARKTPRPN